MLGKHLLHLFFVTVSLCPLSGFGQSGFEITINNEYDEFLIDGTKDFEGNFIITGTSHEVVEGSRDFYHRSALLIKVDTLGQYITTTLQYPDTNCGLFNVMVTADSNYLFAGYIEPYNADSNQLWLYKTDKSLNKIWEKRFRIPLDSGYTQCSFASYGIEDNQGNFVLTAYASYWQSNQDDLVVIKINQQGNVLMSKQFHYQFNQTFHDIITVPNSNDIILIARHLSIIGYQVQLLRLDSVLTTKTIMPISESNYFYGPIGSVACWLSDTSFIYTGILLPPSNPVEDEQIGISILDTTYQPLNETHFGNIDTIDYPPYTNCAAYYNDTTIYVASFVNHLTFWPDDPNQIELYRLDTALNVLASATYGGDAYNRIYGVIAASDGGCLLYGSRYGEENDHEEDIYILKVAKEDLITSNMEEIAQIKIDIEAVVYPNPTNSKLYFDLMGNFDNKTINISIYDSFGRLVKDNQYYHLSFNSSVDCIGFVPGIYYYILEIDRVKILSGKFIKK